MALTGEELIFNLALGYIGAAKIEDAAASRLLKQYLLCARYYEQARDLALESHPWNEAKKRAIIAQDDDNPISGYDRQYTKPTDSLRILSVNDSLGADRRNNADGIYAWEVENGKILANAGEIPQTWVTNTKYVAGEYVSTTAITWITATVYVAGQYITDGTNTHEVLVGHTSDTIVNDVSSGNLDVGIAGTTGSYSVPTTYTSGATVLTDINSSNLTAVGSVARIIFIEYIYQLTDTTKYSASLKDAISQQLAIKIVTGLHNDPKAKVDLINEFERLTMPKARSVDAMQGKPKPIFSSEWIRSRTAGTRSWR